MNMPAKDDFNWLEIVEGLAAEHPIPAGLRQQIADQIEPATMNMGLEHDDTMSAIKIAYPLILGYHGDLRLQEKDLRYLAPDE